MLPCPHPGTGFCTHPSSLLCMRAAAGLCSPLVPASAYVLEDVSTQNAMARMGRIGMSVALAYTLGAGTMAMAYDRIGWRYTHMISAGVAVLAAILTFMIPSPAAASRSRPQSEGLHEALSSDDFRTHAACCVVSGMILGCAGGVTATLFSECMDASSHAHETEHSRLKSAEPTKAGVVELQGSRP